MNGLSILDSVFDALQRLVEGPTRRLCTEDHAHVSTSIVLHNVPFGRVCYPRSPFLPGNHLVLLHAAFDFSIGHRHRSEGHSGGSIGNFRAMTNMAQHISRLSLV